MLNCSIRLLFQEIQYTRGTTDTASALQSLVNSIDVSNGRTSVAVVITDGGSNSRAVGSLRRKI